LLIEQREQEAEKAHKAVKKARTADADAAAEGLKKDSTPKASASRLSVALMEVTASGQRLEVAQGALTKLKDDVDDQQLNVANAENGVLVYTKYVLIAPLQKLYEETAELKKRLAVNQHVLETLLATEHRNDVPRYGAQHSIAEMKAQDARDEPYEELRAKFDDLRFAGVVPDEDVAAIDQEVERWRAARAALLSGNVDVVLPD